MRPHAKPIEAPGTFGVSEAPGVPAAEVARVSSQWGRIVGAGAVAAVLWLVSGGVAQALRWFTSLGSLTSPVLPETMPGIIWMWPSAWGYAAALLGALAIASMTVAVLVVGTRRGASARGRGLTWLAVIIAATLVGFATDVARLYGFGPIPGVGEGLRGRLSIADPRQFAATGAYFGVIYGWIAALVGPQRRDLTPSNPKRRWVVSLLALVAALALLAGYTVVSAEGARVHHEVSQAEVRAAEEAAAVEAGTPRTGAAPDPAAVGEPVPDRAEAAVTRDPAWCSRDAITLMLGLSEEELENGDRGNPELEQGTHDAALGHRSMPLRAVNISDEPCALEGYPDLAFSDQNDHLLDVLITQGDSFMAKDMGPSAVMLQPGETAIARLGWNANSTQGALVAAGVHAAPLAGDTRDVWQLPIALDVTEGSELAVTAWEFAPLPEG